MKKYLYYSVAALALASCSSDSFFGNDAPPRTDNEEEVAIVFGNQTGRPTRAGEVGGAEAAAKLNNNFIVYGFKYEGSEDLTSTANDQVVFDKYNVNYEEGTAGTTESNTANWEYVGNQTHPGSSESDQTIKYWDYSANNYVFSAVSGLGIEASKTTTGSTVYDKGWEVNIPAGGDLSTLYASDREPVEEAKYGETVTLTFRALGTKVRFAMYETVPGYSVHVDKFYYYDNTAWKNTETNFAINGTFKNANASAVTPLTVTYYDDASGIENRPKVTFNDGDVTTGKYGIFGANIQAPGQKLGTTSPEATYDQNDKSYTIILPYESQALSTPEDNILELYVDYTLTSTGGSGEQIHVKHASAKVPTSYTQWKPNFAYTYIFKISDNTNGTTGDTPDDDDPTVDPTDPSGLFPITFDAAVIAEETDLQETITTVSEPSITTYAKGKIVTENDEYTAGDVYFSVMAGDPATLQNLVNHGEVFEVKNFGSIEKNITEEVVQNWKNNFCLLMPVPTTTSVTAVPLSNGTELAFTAGTLGVFQAKAGKTYAIHYNTTDTWKVVKVVGSEASAVTYTQAMPTASITTAAGKAVYSLKASSPVANTMVLGATACLKIFKGAEDVTTNFTITDKLDGTYDIALTTAAIAAGANGTYTVKFNGTACATDFTVGLSYALDPATITVAAGNIIGANTVLKVNTVATDGDVINSNDDIKVEKTATGTYKVTATADATAGNHILTIGGVTLTVTVNSYSFSAPVLTITRPLSTSATGTITLKENGVAKSGISLTTSPALASGTTVAESAGVYTYTVTKTSAGGTYDISYENAKAQVVVNAYTIDTPASIKKSTGATNIVVKCNDEIINASTASLVEQAKPADAVYNVTTNGKVIRFSNASKAGDYTFTYKVKNSGGTNVAVARVTITVTD